MPFCFACGLPGIQRMPPEKAVVPPNWGSFSSTITSSPALRAVIAAASPLAPEPTTRTSQLSPPFSMFVSSLKPRGPLGPCLSQGIRRMCWDVNINVGYPTHKIGDFLEPVYPAGIPFALANGERGGNWQTESAVEKDRLAAFSDGVIAIIITIMVLN